jgi:hypothetical protein
MFHRKFYKKPHVEFDFEVEGKVFRKKGEYSKTTVVFEI